MSASERRAAERGQPAGLAALYGRLTAATVDQNVPCRGRDEWTSSRPADRAHAVAGCAICPAANLCMAYATAAGIDFGVWGGQDRSPRPPGRPRKDARAASATTTSP